MVHARTTNQGIGRWASWTHRLLLMGALAGTVSPAGAQRAGATRGEFGGDLTLLQRSYTAPSLANESNHYIDLWAGRTLATMARCHGLTNNRTLFVDSHGLRAPITIGNRFAYVPHAKLLAPGEKVSHFSARDLAQVVGAGATEIHNIVIGGCNEEGAFKAQELRKHFPNATNITHMVAGQKGFKPLFYGAITRPASENQPLYATTSKDDSGADSYELETSPSPGAKRVDPYLAELFLPHEKKPFASQVAGRELLAPEPEPMRTARSFSDSVPRR